MRAIDAGIVQCSVCHQLAHLNTQRTCQRCGCALHARTVNSISHTWALLLSSLILYVPANLLPIMTVNILGSGTPATIMEGVVELIQAQMWPIALVVFIASILVPSCKIIGLALLLISLQRKARLNEQQRLVMYRFIEWVGRWSMLDIFVIATLVNLVNFGKLASIEPGGGAIAFCAVVILTMLAAHTFDPRLIWDQSQSLQETTNDEEVNA